LNRVVVKWLLETNSTSKRIIVYR